MRLFEIFSKASDHKQPLMGFMDVRGNVLIEPQFLKNASVQGEHFSEAGYAIVRRPDVKQHQIIDAHGNTIFEFPKNHVPSWYNPPDEHGIFGVMHQVDAENPDLWTTVGRDQRFLGTTHYYAMRLDGSIAFEAHIVESRQGHYVVSERSKWGTSKGLMDHTGGMVIPPIYDAIYLSRSDPYATVIRGTQANVLKLDGSPVFRKDFGIGGMHNFRHVKDGLWIVAKANSRRATVFDIASAKVIGRLPMSLSSRKNPKSCPIYSGGFFYVLHPDKGSTYYRPNGSALMPNTLRRPQWFKRSMRTGLFSDERAAFKSDGVWGYLDLEGKIAIPPQFASNLQFRDGLAEVRYPANGSSSDRFCYIDCEGSVVWGQDN